MSRILLVDDDPDVRRAYGHLLWRLRHDVDPAENGREALEKMDSSTYDAIITDVSMPEMDGVSFLRAVRARDLDVPVVMVTGAPELETAVKAVEHGAFRYLSKPLDPDALLDALARAIKYHELARLKREALHILGEEGRALGDRASLEARFSAALRSLRMAFQPIVSARERRVVAYEALLRSSEPTLDHPEHIVRAAERLGRVHDLGRAVRAATARSVAEAAPRSARIFVNLHALDLNDPNLRDPTTPFARLASRAVLEVTERMSLDGVENARGTAAALRKLGFKIAVDDLGAGYAGLTALAILEPEVIKIDMSLARGVHLSTAKQRVIGSMVRLAREMDTELLVEGVETAAERDALLALGCDLLQGFFYATPAFEFADPGAESWA